MIDEQLRFECRECTWAVTGPSWSPKTLARADQHQTETGHTLTEEAVD